MLYEGQIIGCCGLIVNDFNSRMDVWPYLAAVYVHDDYRHKGYASWMIKRMVLHGFDLGFENIYCASDLFSLYEKVGFTHIGKTYHPWGENDLFVINVCERPHIEMSLQ